MKERIVKPFTMWKHFKGTRAFVITVAEHSETGEKLVVYRCMDNNGKTNHCGKRIRIPPILRNRKIQLQPTHGRSHPGFRHRNGDRSHETYRT